MDKQGLQKSQKEKLHRIIRELRRITRQPLVEKGYEGDIGADEIMLLDDASGTDQAGAGRWHDINIEMEDVQPGPSRMAEENCGNSGFRKRKLQTTMEQREPQEENKGSKKRVRFTDEMDEDEEQVEHDERRHKRPGSGEGSMDFRW